jgi:hypothetical protein
MNPLLALARRRFVVLGVIAWTLGVTMARALRLPNDYAESHWLLDYRFGPMKRGLIGSMCTFVTAALNVPMTPRIILVLAGVTLAALGLVVLRACERLVARSGNDQAMAALGLVVVSSPFLVMGAHTIGYFDALLFTLAFLSAGLTLAGRPLHAVVFHVVGVLTHENYLVIGMPLATLASVLAYDSTRRDLRRYVIALVVPVGVIAAVSWYQETFFDSLVFREQLASYLRTFDFVTTRRAAVSRWMTTSLFDSLRQQLPSFRERALSPILIGVIGPSLLTLLYAGHSAFRLRPLRRESWLLVAVALAPMALHAIAWDTERISTYTLGTALLGVWALGVAKAPLRMDRLFWLVALPALVLNVFARTPLMDKEVERFTDATRLLLYAPALLLAAALAAGADHSDAAASDGPADA